MFGILEKVLRLTHIATLVVDLQLPVSLRRLSPGVHRHEGPLIESGTRVVMYPVDGGNKQEFGGYHLPHLPRR